ncbi:MAG TPA: hypothetical protein PLJ27_20330 [Polyangiaceae bacterium]|nr:hypothetical protein [Polyangiaceae bacterium]
MADREDPNKLPPGAFTRTRILGSRNLADLDYDDENPTGTHRSERPANPDTHPAPRVGPDDVFYLTDRNRQEERLPAFIDTIPGPGSLDTAPANLPPVAPIAPKALQHVAVPPTVPQPQPSHQRIHPTRLPSIPKATTTSRFRPRRRKPKHVWKRVVPPPRFPPSESFARPMALHRSALPALPKPMEDRFLSAFAILIVGLLVALGAGLSFLIVSESRIEALAPYISQPWATSPTAPASSHIP